jgi:hypothetical protein
MMNMMMLDFPETRALLDMIFGDFFLMEHKDI